MTALSVARNFTLTPGGRWRRISEFSGEEFLDTYLAPAVRAGEPVQVELDGVAGYGSSFLEQVFGGLVRLMHWRTRDEFDRHVVVKTTRGSWMAEVNEYVNEALERERAAVAH